MSAPRVLDCDHLIRVDWLKQHVAVYHDQSALEADTGRKPSSMAGAAGWLQHEDGQCIFWVFLPRDAHAGTIVHECIHAVDYLCEAAGIPVSVKCSEVRTYLTEWLFEEVTARMGAANA